MIQESGPWCETEEEIVIRYSNKILDSFKIKKNYKKLKPVRIKYNGNFIITHSGKTIWKRIGDAKNALNLHIMSLGGSYYTLKKEFKEDVNFEDCVRLEEEIKNRVYSFVEFVEVDG